MTQKRIAIVTGVTRLKGIGKAICVELARQHTDIFFTFFREYDKTMPWGVEDDEPDRIQEEIRTMGVQCEKMELDLSRTESVALLFDKTEQLLGSSSILVNNAAYSTDTSIDTLTSDELDKHYFVNQRGSILLSQEFVRRFNKKKHGRIINMTTGQSLGAMENEIAYAVTKAALEAFTRHIQHAIAHKNITINTVNPGMTDTGWMDDSTKKEFIRLCPKGRFGEPEDAARLVGFLASEKADWISGQIIHSEGGFFR